MSAPTTRFDVAVRELTRLVVENERELRAMLRLPTDIAGLSPEQARATMRWSANALYRATRG